MAKRKNLGTPAESGKPREAFRVINEDQDISEIVAAIHAGKILEWPSVDKFFPLPDNIVEEMDYQSKQNYFVAKALWEQGKKSPGKGYFGELEVIELIPSNAWNRFKMEAPPDKHVFFPSLEQAKAAEYAGYKYVSRSSTAFKQVLPHSNPERDKDNGLDPDKVYVYNPTTGKPEHVAMYIDKDRYERHLQAVAKRSHDRVISADQDLQEAKKEAAARAQKDYNSYMDIDAKLKVSYEEEELTQVYDPSVKDKKA